MINSGDINFSFKIDNLILNEIIYNNDLWKIFAFVSITNNSILRRREATAPLVSSLVDQLIENVEKWLDLVQPGYVSLSFESLLLPLAIPTLLKSRSPFFLLLTYASVFFTVSTLEWPDLTNRECRTNRIYEVLSSMDGFV